jgi:hypothetical protein
VKTTSLIRGGGILLVGVFLVNVYLGLYDKVLSKYSPAHYDLNWVIALVTLVGAALLLFTPSSRPWVLLAGVVWPLVYIISLFVDASTKMCGGGPASSCFPSTSAAFDYLVLNEATISGAPGYGWAIAPVIPVAIALLVVVIILSLVGSRST